MSLFISLEGGEGSGKTTQITRLAENLSKSGYSVVTTREPGGTPEGEKIRNLLVQREGGEWNAVSEVLLLFAARSMHIEKIIKPALAQGKIVISDRFTDSTLAYQGYGHGFSIEKIKSLSALAIDNFAPDLTFILDIDVKTGLARSSKRLSDADGNDKTEDRFERLDLAFHERLRSGFLEIAKGELHRCRVLNADQSPDDLAAQMIVLVNERLAAR